MTLNIKKLLVTTIFTFLAIGNINVFAGQFHFANHTPFDLEFTFFYGIKPKEETPTITKASTVTFNTFGKRMKGFKVKAPVEMEMKEVLNETVTFAYEKLFHIFMEPVLEKVSVPGGISYKFTKMKFWWMHVAAWRPVIESGPMVASLETQ